MKPQFADVSEWLAYWMERPRLAPAAQRVLERYYRSFYSHFGPYLRKHYAAQIREVEEIVVKRTGCRVLEIGCGCGTESIWLGLLGANVIGIDLDQQRLAVAQARLAHTKNELGLTAPVEFVETSVFEVSRYGVFDVIWMEQAFHHVEPRTEFLKLLWTLLSPGGSVVISDANAWNPFLQLQLLARRGLKTIRQYEDSQGRKHVYGNERITTSGALSRQLERMGFRVKSVRHFRIFPNSPWADRLEFVETSVPAWIKPVFMHFNLVAEQVASSS